MDALIKFSGRADIEQQHSIRTPAAHSELTPNHQLQMALNNQWIECLSCTDTAGFHLVKLQTSGKKDEPGVQDQNKHCNSSDVTALTLHQRIRFALGVCVLPLN